MTLCDENYFIEECGLTRTYSDVVEATKVVAPGGTLDLGCGNDRNSLYLAANDYDVIVWDENPMSVASPERIKTAERLTNLNAKVTDLSTLRFEGEHGFTLSTVVLMFLEAKVVPGFIENMQCCTKPGEYSLVVAAMDTDDFSYTVGPPFAFKTGELRSYYSG